MLINHDDVRLKSLELVVVDFNQEDKLFQNFCTQFDRHNKQIKLVLIDWTSI